MLFPLQGLSVILERDDLDLQLLHCPYATVDYNQLLDALDALEEAEFPPLQVDDADVHVQAV